MMKHTYPVSGMTCTGCEAKVKSSLLTVPGVTAVDVSKDEGTATVEMEKHVGIATLQEALGGENARYKITASPHNETVEAARSWFQTYKPVLLIFAYITAVTLLVQAASEKFDTMTWMRHFMAGFFLVFSFFKLLNLKAFAESYAMYDVIARRIPAWGYVYALTELALGISFLLHISPLLVNAITLVVMLVSIIGVLQTVMNKKKIQCACLGAVFNLPMSTVTIIEDALMIAMSGAMILTMI
jgi:copper chaperone CopZ